MNKLLLTAILLLPLAAAAQAQFSYAVVSPLFEPRHAEKTYATNGVTYTIKYDYVLAGAFVPATFPEGGTHYSASVSVWRKRWCWTPTSS